MRKRRNVARKARLVGDIGQVLIAILQVIKLVVEIVNKAANCHAGKLQIQIPDARQVYFRPK
jgi:hypothetical protein